MSKLRSILLENDDMGRDSKSFIIELVARVFTTRNLLHFEHWNTKSYASHMALGELYDEIVGDIDEIVETYQGRFGLLGTLRTDSAQLPVDIISRVKDESAWVSANRSAIAGGDTSIENLVDTLVGHYHKTVYKLENLK